MDFKLISQILVVKSIFKLFSFFNDKMLLLSNYMHFNNYFESFWITNISFEWLKLPCALYWLKIIQIYYNYANYNGNMFFLLLLSFARICLPCREELYFIKFPLDIFIICYWSNVFFLSQLNSFRQFERVIIIINQLIVYLQLLLLFI